MVVRNSLIGQMRFADRRNDILTAKKRGQPDILLEIGNAFGVHQVAVPAHGERNQLVSAKQILNCQQLLKGHIRKDVFRPALCRRQFNVMETRPANARDGLFDGVAVIAVGIDRDDALHAASLPDHTSLVFTRRPASEDSIAAKTARMAVSTLCASMPCTVGSFSPSTNRSIMPDLVWLSLV